MYNNDEQKVLTPVEYMSKHTMDINTYNSRELNYILASPLLRKGLLKYVTPEHDIEQIKVIEDCIRYNLNPNLICDVEYPAVLMQDIFTVALEGYDISVFENTIPTALIGSILQCIKRGLSVDYVLDGNHSLEEIYCYIHS